MLSYHTVATDMMTSEMSVAPILGAANLNEAHGYYQCSDGSNFTRSYYRNHPRCYCARL
jgi:hypothetical protein